VISLRDSGDRSASGAEGPRQVLSSQMFEVNAAQETNEGFQ
jgi:hypothetical protein